MLKPVIILFSLCFIHNVASFKINTEEFPDLQIVGGNVTDILQHPWQISLRLSDSFHCSGSIIADTWIVTAAHCAVNLSIKELKIRVGSTFLSTGGDEYNVSKNIIHSGYNPQQSLQNDIAVIQVDRPINHPNASIINLPSQDKELEGGTNVTVSGWGSTEIFGPQVEVLLEIIIPTIDEEDCREMFIPLKLNVTEGMLCAGSKGKVTCYGDSGGPVALDETLYGIVSWGAYCNADYPAVFTQVSKYVDWIKDNTGI